jgi:hypothetical protein
MIKRENNDNYITFVFVQVSIVRHDFQYHEYSHQIQLLSWHVAEILLLINLLVPWAEGELYDDIMAW